MDIYRGVVSYWGLIISFHMLLTAFGQMTIDYVFIVYVHIAVRISGLFVGGGGIVSVLVWRARVCLPLC